MINCFNVFLLFACMYLYCLVCTWRVDEEPFENFQDQDFEDSEQQQVTEEGKYIPWSYLILITFILSLHALILMGTYCPYWLSMSLNSRVSFIKSFWAVCLVAEYWLWVVYNNNSWDRILYLITFWNNLMKNLWTWLKSTMERPPGKIAQPQRLHGSGLCWLIRFL